MRDIIGTVPHWEEPTSVMDENYFGKVLEECLQFIECLTSWVGQQPGGLTFEIMEDYHRDTGVFFYNMDVVYPDNNNECSLYARMCKDHCPKRWKYYQLPKRRRR